jgi:SAM-dependent methyltransferase
MVAILGYSRDQILAAVKDMYTEVAAAPTAPYHFPVGREACRLAGYPDEQLGDLPEGAIASFAGVGYPFRAGVVRAGDVVLDIGSGSGTDALLAGRLAGQQGKVWALDMTPAMIEKLRATVANMGLGNVEAIEGSAEHIPLPDNSVDVVTSNGVLNLVPDKRRAIAEIFRVLRPGGRVQIADVVISRPVTPDCLGDPKLWAECVVGATVDEDYLEMFRDAGFVDVTVLREFDYFANSPSLETRKVAGTFGARAIELTMRRGERPAHKALLLARRADPRRLFRAVERRGLTGLVALGLALMACYGALAALALLSLLGVALTIHEAAWAGVIFLFAALTALAVAGGLRRHGSVGPLGLATLGAGLIAYTLFASYEPVTEFVGFGLLAAATFWDYRLRRRTEAKPLGH